MVWKMSEEAGYTWFTEECSPDNCVCVRARACALHICVMASVKVDSSNSGGCSLNPDKKKVLVCTNICARMNLFRASWLS